ncbi:MAG: hypothetical protein AAFR00_13530 [Pseudomonadota bacterium]
MQHLQASAMTPLSARQYLICAIFGGVLWFAAAFLLRYVGPLGVYEGSGRALLYGLVIPGTVPFVFMIRWAAGLTKAQTALAVAFATASALVLDGMATAWMPGLYGATDALVLGAAAAILWGGGVAIFLGFLFSR